MRFKLKKLLFSIALMCTAFFSFGADAPKFTDLGAEDVAQINQYAENLIESMRKRVNPEFSYDEKSVHFLSDNITKERNGYSERAKGVLPTVYGAYLGVAIIKKYGGKWVTVEGVGYGVMIDEYNVTFPFNKVSKHIQNGEEDSIYTLYMTANKIQEYVKDKG